MNFKTDFNTRERARLAEKLRSLAQSAEICAAHLVAELDSDFMMAFLFLSLNIAATKEVSDLLQEQLKNNSEFPEVIDG